MITFFFRSFRTLIGVAAYPLTLLSASIKAMKSALALLKAGKPTDELILPFGDLQYEVGFEKYYKDLDRYDSSN